MMAMKEKKFDALLRKALYLSPHALQKSIGFVYLHCYLPLRLGLIEYLRFYNLLERSQWWPRWKIEQYQMGKLKQLLRYAYNNIPYYTELFRKLNIKPDDFNSIHDLKKLPVLGKEDIVDNFDKLVSRRIKKGNLKLVTTSGSTGKVMEFYQHVLGFDYIDYAFSRRCHSWANVKLDDRHVQLWSRPFIEGKINALYLYHPLANSLSLSTVPLSSSILSQYIELIRKFNPIFIIGNPSILYNLACYAQENSVNYLKFRSFISLFENLLPHQREQIENQFKCQLYNRYSSMERVISAMECSKHEGMHIEMERGILEILDDKGKVLPEGDTGRLVATGLHGYVMPFIRYDTGDVGSISTKACSCGRGLPLLKSLDGRISETIKYKNKIVYSTTLSVIIWKFTNIKECQFTQEAEDEIKVNIVKRNDYSEQDSQELIKILKEKIGSGLKVNISFADHIPRTGMGKFPFIISKI
mgnify:CR=1 FL=1